MAKVFGEGIIQALIRRGVSLRASRILQQETGYSLDYDDPRVLDATRVLRERYS